MGNLAGLILINQGTELAAGQGLDEAVRVARMASLPGGSGLGVFATLSGGRSRYDTGSHLNMESLSLMAGLSFGFDFSPSFLTVGAFIEYGNGSYDSYNSFVNAASVNGDGEMRIFGGGVAGRLDFADNGKAHLYTEGSLRVGTIHNEFDSHDLLDAMGHRAQFVSSSSYLGFHFGLGCIFPVTQSATFDLYGKYFWTRQEGESVRLSTGDPVTFEDADSSRLRLGLRLTYAVSERFDMYIGAAWENEFDGVAGASTNGFAIDKPSLRGDTGIGMLGISLKPSESFPMTIDLWAQGYAGKRKGVTGSLRLSIGF
jgi:outer membrane autotransporter protein